MYSEYFECCTIMQQVLAYKKKVTGLFEKRMKKTHFNNRINTYLNWEHGVKKKIFFKKMK